MRLFASLPIPCRLGWRIVYRESPSATMGRGLVVERKYAPPFPAEDEIDLDYLEAEESGQLASDSDLAVELAGQLRSVGRDVVTVFLEIVMVPADLSNPHAELYLQRANQISFVLARLHEAVPAPRALHVLGYDINTPHATHSAVHQPGMLQRALNVAPYLNHHGFVSELEEARALMQAANDLDYGADPFCVIAVSH